MNPLRWVYAGFDKAGRYVFWAELVGGLGLAVLAAFGVLPSIRVAACIGFVVLAHQGYEALRDET